MNLFDVMLDEAGGDDARLVRVPSWLDSIEATLTDLSTEFDVLEPLTVLHMADLPLRYRGVEGLDASVMTVRDVRRELERMSVDYDMVCDLGMESVSTVWPTFDEDYELMVRMDEALFDRLTDLRNPVVTLPRREVPQPRWVTTMEIPVVVAVPMPDDLLPDVESNPRIAAEAEDILKMLERQ